MTGRHIGQHIFVNLDTVSCTTPMVTVSFSMYIRPCRDVGVDYVAAVAPPSVVVVVVCWCYYDDYDGGMRSDQQTSFVTTVSLDRLG